MDVFESLVLRHLTKDPNVFASWQCSITDLKGKEWSCPDFVALDITKKKVLVVEVSSAYDINGLIEKVNRRDQQWFGLLRQQLEKSILVKSDWQYEVYIFVRPDAFEKYGHKLQVHSEVHVLNLEDVAHPWRPDPPRALAAARA